MGESRGQWYFSHMRKQHRPSTSLNFALSHHLHSYLACASVEASGETAHVTRALAARMCDECHDIMNCLNFPPLDKGAYRKT